MKIRKTIELKIGSRWLYVGPDICPASSEHVLVFVDSKELITISEDGGWRGPLSLFIKHFEYIREQKTIFV